MKEKERVLVKGVDVRMPAKAVKIPARGMGVMVVPKLITVETRDGMGWEESLIGSYLDA